MEHSTLKWILIAAIIALSILNVILIILAIVQCLRRKKNKKQEDDEYPTDSETGFEKTQKSSLALEGTQKNSQELYVKDEEDESKESKVSSAPPPPPTPKKTPEKTPQKSSQYATKKASEQGTQKSSEKGSQKSETSIPVVVPVAAADESSNSESEDSSTYNPTATTETETDDDSQLEHFIKADVEKLDFPSGSNTKQAIHVGNLTKKKRIAVKVLCSNNNVYNVEPVYSFLEPGTEFSFEVYRMGTSQPAPQETLLFAYLPCNETDEDAAALFRGVQAKRISVALMAK